MFFMSSKNSPIYSPFSPQYSPHLYLQNTLPDFNPTSSSSSSSNPVHGTHVATTASADSTAAMRGLDPSI